MGTFKHIHDKIFINEIEISLSLFKVLEPKYRYDENTEMLVYSKGSLKMKIGNVTTSSGAWPEGERYISRERDFKALVKMAQKEDAEIAKEVEAIRDPSNCRKNEYPTIEEMVVAMWEKMVEKKSDDESGIKDLQSKRVEIKNKYPLKKEEEPDGTDKIEGSPEAVLPKVSRRTRNRSKHSG